MMFIKCKSHFITIGILIRRLPAPFRASCFSLLLSSRKKIYVKYLDARCCVRKSRTIPLQAPSSLTASITTTLPISRPRVISGENVCQEQEKEHCYIRHGKYHRRSKGRYLSTSQINAILQMAVLYCIALLCSPSLPSARC